MWGWYDMSGIKIPPVKVSGCLSRLSSVGDFGHGLERAVNDGPVYGMIWTKLNDGLFDASRGTAK